MLSPAHCTSVRRNDDAICTRAGNQKMKNLIFTANGVKFRVKKKN